MPKLISQRNCMNLETFVYHLCAAILLQYHKLQGYRTINIANTVVTQAELMIVSMPYFIDACEGQISKVSSSDSLNGRHSSDSGKDMDRPGSSSLSGSDSSPRNSSDSGTESNVAKQKFQVSETAINESGLRYRYLLNIVQ